MQPNLLGDSGATPASNIVTRGRRLATRVGLALAAVSFTTLTVSTSLVSFGDYSRLCVGVHSVHLAACKHGYRIAESVKMTALTGTLVFLVASLVLSLHRHR